MPAIILVPGRSEKDTKPRLFPGTPAPGTIGHITDWLTADDLPVTPTPTKMGGGLALAPAPAPMTTQQAATAFRMPTAGTPPLGLRTAVRLAAASVACAITTRVNAVADAGLITKENEEEVLDIITGECQPICRNILGAFL